MLTVPHLSIERDSPDSVDIPIPVTPPCVNNFDCAFDSVLEFELPAPSSMTYPSLFEPWSQPPIELSPPSSDKDLQEMNYIPPGTLPSQQFEEFPSDLRFSQPLFMTQSNHPTSHHIEQPIPKVCNADLSTSWQSYMEQFMGQ
jgi:hypothetical protein